MKALKLWHLCKGKQDFNIGDNVKDYLDKSNKIEEGFDYSYLNWGFKTKKLAEEITQSFDVHERGRRQNGGENCTINECIVITTQSGTIRGVMPINGKH